MSRAAAIPSADHPITKQGELQLLPFALAGLTRDSGFLRDEGSNDSHRFAIPGTRHRFAIPGTRYLFPVSVGPGEAGRATLCIVLSN